MAGTEGKITKPVITVKDLYKVYRIGGEAAVTG